MGTFVSLETAWSMAHQETWQGAFSIKCFHHASDLRFLAYGLLDMEWYTGGDPSEKGKISGVLSPSPHYLHFAIWTLWGSLSNVYPETTPLWIQVN